MRKILHLIHELIFGTSPEKGFIEALIVFFLLLGVGTVFYSQVEGWSYLDSVYFSVTTIATVGFGDLYPTTPESKIFTIFYIFFGVGLGIFILSTFAKNILEGREKRMKKLEELIEHLKEKE